MPQIRLDEARGLWQLGEAVAEARPGNLFPSRVARSAIDGNDYFLKVLDGLAASGFEPRPVQFVSVPKLDGGTRPAADMPIEDEVLLTALEQVIKSQMQPDMVEFTGRDISYADFENFPLVSAEASAFVLMADVVSFYEYVDHDRLEREIVGMTGLAETAESLVDLLEVWMGAPRGLPQGPHASEPLADLYIAPASRALSRAGFDHSRYSDDFRVPAVSWSDARSSQLILERSLREIGLTLSAPKVRTPRIETYRGYLEVIPATAVLSPTEREVLEAQEDEYFGGVTYSQVGTEEELEKAVQVFNEQVGRKAADVVSTRLMRWCLPRLGAAASTDPLLHFRPLLSRYAQITPSIAFYVRMLMGSDFEEDAVKATTEWLNDPTFKYAWQAGWLLNALAFARQSSPEVRNIAQRMFFNDAVPWFVRGQAAIVAATERVLPPHRRFFDVYERCPEATKPDLIAAVVIQEAGWAPTFLRGAVTTPVLATIATFDRSDFQDWI